MRSGGGHAKGAEFERTVCKQLSSWLSHGAREDLLWRSSMSGGRSTVALKKGTKLGSQAGDISSIDALSHAFIQQFSIECKAYRDLGLGGMIKGKSTLIDFWQHHILDCQHYHKKPLLIAKQNNHPVFICMSNRGSRTFRVNSDEFRVIVPYADLKILLFDVFLKINPLIIREDLS